MLHGPLAAISIAALCACACASPPHPKLPPHDALSFDVIAAAVPQECTPTCKVIELSVRNTSSALVRIDWTQSKTTHNGQPVGLVIDRSDSTTEIRPAAASTFRVTPQPGAPNASALEEGRFRNGHYTFVLGVVTLDGKRSTTTASVDVKYTQAPET